MMAVNLLKSAGYEVLPVFLPLSGGMTLAKNASRAEDFAEGKRYPVVELSGAALERRGLFRRRTPSTLPSIAATAAWGRTARSRRFLPFTGLPSASPSMELSAAFMDKSLAKLFLKGLGLPVLPSVCVREGEGERAKAEAKKLGYPLVVKPCRLGSSIGVSVVGEERETHRRPRPCLPPRQFGAPRALPRRSARSQPAPRCGGEKSSFFPPIEEVLSSSPFSPSGKSMRARSAAASSLPTSPKRRQTPSAPPCVRSRKPFPSAAWCGEISFLQKTAGCISTNSTRCRAPLPLSLRRYAHRGARFFSSPSSKMPRSPPAKPPLSTGLLSRTRFAGAKGCKNRSSVL